MKRWQQADVIAGALFAGFGVVTLWVGRGYPVGTLRRIGPGAVPDALGLFLIAIGLGIAILGLLRDGETILAGKWRIAAPILASILVFAILIDRAGLVAAGLMAMLVSRLAAPPFRPLETGLAALGITLLTVAIFIWGLKLPMPVLPP